MGKEKLHAADLDEILRYVLDLEGNEEDDVVEASLMHKYNLTIDDFQEIAQKLYDAIDISYSQLTKTVQMGFGDGALWMAKKDITSKFINVLIDWMGTPNKENPKYERVITKKGKPDYRVVLEKLSEEEQYMVWTKGYVGNSLIFWRDGKAGYTTDLAKAHRFTYEEALQIQKGCHGDHQLIPLSHLNSIATRQVNAEHLDRSLVGKEAFNA